MAIQFANMMALTCQWRNANVESECRPVANRWCHAPNGKERSRLGTCWGMLAPMFKLPPSMSAAIFTYSKIFQSGASSPPIRPTDSRNRSPIQPANRRQNADWSLGRCSGGSRFTGIFFFRSLNRYSCISAPVRHLDATCWPSSHSSLIDCYRIADCVAFAVIVLLILLDRSIQGAITCHLLPHPQARCAQYLSSPSW